MIYPDNEKVKDSLLRYFDHNHFNNGGYDDKTFTIKFWGPFKLVFPNVKARVDAVKLHDIHHVLTQCETTLRGEAEIGAWELAAGCGKYLAAWVLNSGSFAFGFAIWPRRMYKSFAWGRRSNSLYHHDIYKEYNSELLSATVGEVRSRLHVNAVKSKSRFLDNVLFASTVLIIEGSILLGLGVAVWLAMLLLK